MATRAVEPDDQAAGDTVEQSEVATGRIIDADAGRILEVETVGDLSVVRRIEVPQPTERPDAASPRTVFAYVPRRARPPWAKPDVLVLGDDLPNYLRAERSFHHLTETGLKDLLAAPPLRNGKRNASPIVGLPAVPPNGLSRVVRLLDERGIAVAPLRSLVAERCRLAFLDEPVSVSRATWLRRAVIRTIDLVLGAIGTAIFLALLPLVALAIWAEDRGPVFYVQERLGRKGKPFPLLKFRSMRRDAEEAGPVWATLRDDRVTRVGALMRRYKIDELPQFLNVLAGHMGIVGPRPERVVFVDTLRKLIPHYDARDMVRPGITGWGTVKVGYGNSVEAKYLTHQYDLYHMKNRTLSFDLEIMARSVFAIMLRGERQDRFML